MRPTRVTRGSFANVTFDPAERSVIVRTFNNTNISPWPTRGAR
jgi:hypothetical protein